MSDLRKIVTIVGARPQFVKAAVVSRSLRSRRDYGSFLEEIIIHTGQHFDDNMSQIFFDELKIPTPDHYLNLGGGSHGQMTGAMLTEIEKKLIEIEPSLVLVYGDTNSTLAGALAASKLHIPVAHVEAGLRSYNRDMPEEINRVLTDQISSLLFCPSHISVSNLAKEGIVNGVHNTGDVMYDATLFYEKLVTKSQHNQAESPKVNPENGKKSQILLTLHRQENVDHPERLREIVGTFTSLSKDYEIIFPIHPRTEKMCAKLGLDLSGISVLKPLGYLELLTYLRSSQIVATDSGGLQKEAFYMRKPCAVLRNETEWLELIETGSNVLCGSSRVQIEKTIRGFEFSEWKDTFPYGKGDAGEKIASLIWERLQD